MNDNADHTMTGYSKTVVKHKGSQVSFHDVFYDVQINAGCCKKAPQTILTDINGLFKPGTMNAIMGPTGSGKSSLLDVLAARKDPHGLSGSVLINGHPQPADFRLMSGYVVQDDVVMGTLSVRENLRFSADLRLPKGYSSDERAEAVNRVIGELGLESCADTRIGDEFTRGVSGGERKRCNIGMELINDPGVLFLDEPTTGLDASTARSVMLTLRRLADNGSTIIFSIHQPRYSIFKLCDSLCLLGNGRTIYHGPANQAIDFFKSIGYEIEEHDNPADFFLDVILGNVECSQPSLTAPKTSNGELTIEFSEESGSGEKIKSLSLELSEKFKASQWGKDLEAEVKPLVVKVQQSGEHMPDVEKLTTLTYNTNPCQQFGIVCLRTIKNLLRNPRASSLQVITTIFFALITGAIYFDIPDDCKSGIQNRVGAFFFIVMNQVFSSLSSIDLFIAERKIFIHENISGFYRVSSYFFAKLICDVIPNRTVPSIIFTCIAYWMLGLMPRADSFFFFLLVICLTSLAGASFGFAASATTREPAIANLMCALLFVFQMIFAGLLINLDSIGDWISWAKYVSVFNYAMNALLINEFRHLNFAEVTNGTETSDCVSEYMEDNGIKYAEPWDWWQQILALVCFVTIVLGFTYIQLRRIKKLK